MRFDEEPINFEEVARLQNLDEQIHQRLHGNVQGRSDAQDALDPQLLHDLHDLYQPRGQAFQQGLNRVWGRLEQSGTAAMQRQPPGVSIPRPGARQERIVPMPDNIRSGWSARLGALIAAVVAVVLVAALALGLILVRANGANTAGNHSSQTGSSQTTKTTSATPFSVSSVDLAVSPTSIAGKTCGSSASFTYTATFHIPAGTAGGTIQFQYTLNNGRSSTSGSIVVGAGKTSATYTFTSSGTLPPDHTYPGIAEVLVTAPNSVHSPQVQPSGACVAQTAAFQVTSVSMAVSPTTIAGKACGTPLTVTYTATFHLLANGPGGTIHFEYTVNNGRGSTLATLVVAAGQTTATYSFTWSGTLPPDHTYPENGGVIVDSPNQASSPLVGPAGACS